jgi:hypothetical protein
MNRKEYRQPVSPADPGQDIEGFAQRNHDSSNNDI